MSFVDELDPLRDVLTQADDDSIFDADGVPEGLDAAFAAAYAQHWTQDMDDDNVTEKCTLRRYWREGLLQKQEEEEEEEEGYEVYDDDVVLPPLPNHHQIGAWQCADQPASFHADFPVSIDNFDCHRLARDLVYECGVRVPPRGADRWALWLGKCFHENVDEDEDGGRRVLPGQSPLPEKILRVRSVDDLLEGLDQVRRDVQQQTRGGRMVVLFMVAAIYGEPSDEDDDEDSEDSEDGIWIRPEEGWQYNSDDDYMYSDSDGFYGSEEEEEESSYGYDDDSDDSDASRLDPSSPQFEEDDDGRARCTCRACRMDDDAYYSPGPDSPPWPFYSSHGESEGELSPSLGRLGLEPEDDEDEDKEEDEDEEEIPLLATLDTSVSKGDAFDGDLHAFLPEAASPSSEEWTTCCRLLGIDPDAHRDPRKRSIAAPGAQNLQVSPSQYWTAYWMLTSRADRGLDGGVLADVMGTGKTYVCLLACLLRSCIGCSRAEVEREWQLRAHEEKKGKTGKRTTKMQHLPATTKGDVPCPCGNSLGIECYANPGGVTRRLADAMARGPSLVLAPQAVLDNWVRAVKTARLHQRVCEPFVFHSNNTKSTLAPEDVAMVPDLRLKQRLRVGVRCASRPDGFFAGNVSLPLDDDAQYDFVPSVAKDAFPERFLFLASHAPQMLTSFFQVGIPVKNKDKTTTHTKDKTQLQTVYACPVGMQIVDEFHKAGPASLSLAHQHQQIHPRCSFWAVTGTPMPHKLTDLAPVVELVSSKTSQEGDNTMASRLSQIQSDYDHVTTAVDATAEQADQVAADARAFFQDGLVMRHTEAATFFGQPLFALQDVAPQSVVHETPVRFRSDVAKVAARVEDSLRAANSNSNSNSIQWDHIVRSGPLFNHMLDLEIVATFPGAARLLLAHPPAIDFSLPALREQIRSAPDGDLARVPLFASLWQSVVQDSPHMAAILAMLDEALEKNQKLLILCPRLGEAVFVYLALRHQRPDALPAFIHGDMKLAERAAIVKSFQSVSKTSRTSKTVKTSKTSTTKTSKTSNTSKTKTNKKPQVLIGSFRDAGTGNDLSAASYQILTGPLRLRSQQDQAFGRTNREGQKYPLHHQLLLTADNPVDRIVVATQARRRIASNPFSIEQELELEEECK